MLGRRHRPQRKLKKINLSEEDFLQSVNEVLQRNEQDPEILNEKEFEDIMKELVDIDNINKLLQQHALKFIERLFYGDKGILTEQQQKDIQAKEYSFFTSKGEQLDLFIKSYKKFSVRFPILQQYCEQILEKTLISTLQQDDETNQQIYTIIAKLLQQEIYQRNRKVEFFIYGAIQQQRLTLQVSQLLNVILQIYGKENTYNLLQENQFIEKAKECQNFDYDEFIQQCNWISQYEQQMRQEELINQAEPECIKAIEKINKDTTDEQIKQIEKKLEEIYEYKNDNTNEQKLITCINVIISGSCHEHAKTVEESKFIFKKLIHIIQNLVQTVPQQGLLIDLLSKTCYQNMYAHDRFKQFLFILYNNQILDGNVIVAWFERSREIGKSSFGRQLQQFVQWINKEE